MLERTDIAVQVCGSTTMARGKKNICPSIQCKQRHLWDANPRGQSPSAQQADALTTRPKCFGSIKISAHLSAPFLVVVGLRLAMSNHVLTTQHRQHKPTTQPPKPPNRVPNRVPDPPSLSLSPLPPSSPNRPTTQLNNSTAQPPNPTLNPPSHSWVFASMFAHFGELSKYFDGSALREEWGGGVASRFQQEKQGSSIRIPFQKERIFGRGRAGRRVGAIFLCEASCWCARGDREIGRDFSAFSHVSELFTRISGTCVRRLC